MSWEWGTLRLTGEAWQTEANNRLRKLTQWLKRVAVFDGVGSLEIPASLTVNGGIVVTNDINSIGGGGFRDQAEGFYQDNVTASQTNVELTRADGRWRAVRAGSVTGVLAALSEARTAGTLTVEVYKNTGLQGAAGSGLGLTAVIDGTNTSRKATTQSKDTDTFAAGDEIYAVVTTDGSWLPTTADLKVTIEVET